MADTYINMIQLELEYLQKPVGNYLDVTVPLPNNYELHCDIYRVENNTELTNKIFTGCTGNDDHTQIIIGENLWVRSGITFTPPYRCKGLFIFSIGSFVNNGTISMSARGASASGADIPLIEDYKISAVGGAGGNSGSDSNGNKGSTPSTLSCAGGGSGGSANTSLPSYKGGTGTSFSGGAGSGGTGNHSVGTPPSDTGGAGGNSAPPSYYWRGSFGGGAGNPGGRDSASNINYSTPGENGTGGLLVIFANNLEQKGSLTAMGTSGGSVYNDYKYHPEYGSSGGGSGGGCIVLISDNFTITGSYNVNGGTGGTVTGPGSGRTGGAGGTGRYEEIIIPDLDITVHNTDNQVYLYYAEKSKITNPNKISIYNGQIILQLEKFGFAYDLNDKRYHFSIDDYYSKQEISEIFNNIDTEYTQGNGITIDENTRTISIDLSYFIDDEAEDNLDSKVYSITKINTLLETLTTTFEESISSLEETISEIDTSISEEQGNIIEQKEDGIYATISLATQQQIAEMIERIWNKTNFISQDNMSILTADGQILKAKEE